MEQSGIVGMSQRLQYVLPPPPSLFPAGPRRTLRRHARCCCLAPRRTLRDVVVMRGDRRNVPVCGLHNAHASRRYAAHAVPQQELVRSTLALVSESARYAASRLLEACARDGRDTVPAFALVDYGCADGGNSVELVQSVLRAVADAQASQDATHRASIGAVCAYMNDLPSANWAAVARHLGGLAAPPPMAYLLSLCPRSFFERVVPDDSVDLAYSSASMHWLSHPVMLATSVYGALADDAEQARWREQADRDWRDLLALRVRELRVGGRFVVALGAESDDGEYAYSEVFRMLDRIVQRLVDAGLISTDDRRRLAISACTRTFRQIQQPFTDTGQGAMEFCDSDGRRLRWVSAERGILLPDPYFAAAKGVSEAYAAQQTASVRAWSEAHFEAALNDPPQRSEATQAAIVTLIFDMLRRAIADMRPMRALGDYHVVRLVCERVA